MEHVVQMSARDTYCDLKMAHVVQMSATVPSVKLTNAAGSNARDPRYLLRPKNGARGTNVSHCALGGIWMELGEIGNRRMVIAARTCAFGAPDPHSVVRELQHPAHCLVARHNHSAGNTHTHTHTNTCARTYKQMLFQNRQKFVHLPTHLMA